MITFNQACKNVYDYISGSDNYISQIYEVEKGWVFLYRDEPEDVVLYGVPSVFINMHTGEIEFYSIPENIEELNKAKELRIPREYKK